ncbi:GNAT family N-acetyltransferase [Methylomagnum ishizawai]|uniref:GNAT family N-acetyltransferase n=1 Tax=Methylomagnum ishizawai TaxID=1760988 RepID=UPI000A162B69|nr:GNAT family N-acetyltransferase [Methylomagnum ishizawai]
MSVLEIEKLRFDHDTERFDCGKSELNSFLKQFAFSNQRANLAQTYVLCRDKKIVAYYSLAVGHADHRDAPSRVTQGIGRYPVPLMILARLAVALDEQGNGFGAAMLKDALQRTIRVADIAGIRALFVHAKDDEARAFYEYFNFRPSPIDPYQLFLLTKDIRRLVM